MTTIMKYFGNKAGRLVMEIRGIGGEETRQAAIWSVRNHLHDFRKLTDEEVIRTFDLEAARKVVAYQEGCHSWTQLEEEVGQPFLTLRSLLDKALEYLLMGNHLQDVALEAVHSATQTTSGDDIAALAKEAYPALNASQILRRFADSGHDSDTAIYQSALVQYVEDNLVPP